MARRFISDMKAGERLEDQVFLINQKDLRTTTQGALYIHAVLADRTGQLPARMWQATETIYQFMPEGGFMRFTGRCENYKGNLQFIIDGLGEAPMDSIELGDFLKRTDRDTGEMWTRLQAILAENIKHPQVKALVDEFLTDHGLMKKFRVAPAAIQLHHAYIGGLLEHTLGLLEVALRVVPLYPKVSMDIVLAGLFLHDIAKTTELKYDTNFAYSEEGQLVGHVAQGAIWIQEKAAAVESKTGQPVPGRIKWALQHILVSHHGQYEFGALKLPATPEAVMIHHLDNLDAKVNLYLSQIEEDPDPASVWTKYHRALQTKIYKPNVLSDPGKD